MDKEIGKPIRILLVEDNPADARWVEELFKNSRNLRFRSTNQRFVSFNIPIKLYVVEDGVEALDFLYQKGNYKNSPCPDIIILDLLLPRVDGHEVLKKIKNDKKLKSTPVIVLTTSDSPKDLDKAYRNYANCYVKKSIDFEELTEIIEYVENFWLNVAKIPECSEKTGD